MIIMSEVKNKVRVINASQVRKGVVKKSSTKTVARHLKTAVKEKETLDVDDDLEDEGTYLPAPKTKTSNLKITKPSVKVRDDLEESDEDDLGYKVKTVEKSQELVSRIHSILAQLDKDRETNGVGEDHTYEFYRAALLDTLELIPIARRSYVRYQSQSNAYAYAGLVTKCQELIADMQALSDKSNLLQRLLDKTIIPSYVNMIGNLANSFSLIKVEIQGLGLSPSDESRVVDLFKSYTRGLGQYMQDSENSLINELKGEMSEED